MYNLRLVLEGTSADHELENIYTVFMWQYTHLPLALFLVFSSSLAVCT